MTNPLPELQKGDAIRYGKDWMSFIREFKWHTVDEAFSIEGWNFDSDMQIQMVTVPKERIQEVWRALVCIWRKV